MSSKLQNKLLNYQPEPPAGAWDEIAAALDNASSTSYSEKLFHFEQTPPPAVWSKLEAVLDAEAPAKVVRMGRGRWIAAAAAVLIIAFFATTFVMNRQSGSGSGIASEPTVQRAIPAPADTDTTTLDTEIPQEETVTQSPQAETETNAPSPGRSIATARPIKRRPVIAAAALGPALPRWEKAERKQQLNFSVPPDRYMVYSDGKNSPVKLSKKMFDVFSCAQEDLRCRERIQSLQQKIANAAVASDFTGMLDLLNHLRENQ